MQYFTLFLSGDSKQDADTTTTHSKRLISLIKNKKVLTTSLRTIWENTDVFAEQYIFASALYLMSVISQTYSLIIDRGISAPGHGKEVVAFKRRELFQDVLCRRDYAERVVASFANKIQSEYYGGNISMSI